MSGRLFIVFRKELLDALRDKRTLFATIILPLLLLPVIMFGFGAAASASVRKVQKEGFNIVILGEEHAPKLVSSLRGTSSIKIENDTNNLAERISLKKLRAAVVVPPNFENDLEKRNEPAPLEILHYAGEMRSQFAVRTLQSTIRVYSDSVVSDRLSAANLPTDLIRPFTTEEKNIAPPEKVGGNIFGGLIPYLIIFLSFVGAMGPAIDLTAGEKERGTIETILASPVSRTDLVLGKFLMVLTASLVTTLISLSSFAITFVIPSAFIQQLSRVGGGAGLQISGTNILAVFALVFPLAILFSAGLLAIALLARTFKEAQSYLSPLMMLIVLPAMAALLPGIEPRFPLTLIPVLNVSLISKEVLSGLYHWPQLLMVWGSTWVYAGLALASAVWMFRRESVLFRS